MGKVSNITVTSNYNIYTKINQIYKATIKCAQVYKNGSSSYGYGFYTNCDNLADANKSVMVVGGSITPSNKFGNITVYGIYTVTRAGVYKSQETIMSSSDKIYIKVDSSNVSKVSGNSRYPNSVSDTWNLTNGKTSTVYLCNSTFANSDLP